MSVGFWSRKLQMFCLEGRFLNISLVGTTDLLRVFTWIKSSNFIVWSCKTAHRGHSEVPFFKKKPNPKHPFPNEGKIKDDKNVSEFSAESKLGAPSPQYILFWLDWTTILHLGENPIVITLNRTFLLRANVLIRNFRKRNPTNDNLMRPIQNNYVRSVLTKKRGILEIFLPSFNCLTEGNKHLFAQNIIFCFQRTIFLVFGKKVCVRR